MKCGRCKSNFEDVLEKIEFFVPCSLDLIVVKNDSENPCCVDCMQEIFLEVLESEMPV